jgi:hypothetical protein
MAEEGKTDRIAGSYVGGMVLVKVMRENGIDAFVHQRTPCQPKIQG